VQKLLHIQNHFLGDAIITAPACKYIDIAYKMPHSKLTVLEAFSPYNI